MTLDDRDALNALNRRLKQISGTVTFIADHARRNDDVSGALHVVANALEEACDCLTAILSVPSISV